MIDEQTKTQAITIQNLDSFHVMGDSCYKAERQESSDMYASHLYSALMGECVAVDECDFEDGYRYTVEQQTKQQEQVDDRVENEAPTVFEGAPVVGNSVKTQTVRAFNRKRIPWLVAYVVVTLAAVLVLALTLPGTSWESEVGIKTDILTTQPAYAESADSLMDTICLPDGTTKVVSLTPYETTETETNWFDEVCDWISHVIGG